MLRLSSLLLRISVMTPRTALQTLGLSQAELSLQHHKSPKDLTRLLKKNYVARTLECHPDLFPDDSTAADRFRELTEALRIALQFTHTFGLHNEELKSTSSNTVADMMLGWGLAWRQQKETVLGEKHTSQAVIVDPTLPDIVSLCEQEAVAIDRVQRFCEEVPSVLCGKQPAMFETFAFHEVRCVQPITNVVLKVAEDLPRLVKRVVVQRQPDYKYDISMHGFGSGNDIRRRKIDEMLMKPLVLVGALVMLPNRTAAQYLGFEGMEETCSKQQGSKRYMVVGRTQVTTLSDIHCTRDLMCVLHGDQTLDEMAKSVAVWESQSFNRVRVELAIGNVCALIASMLCLHQGIVVPNDLTLSLDQAKRISLTLQRLAMSLCMVADVDGVAPVSKGNVFPLPGTNVSPLEGKEHSVNSHAADLVRSIRELAGDPDCHDALQRPLRLKVPLSNSNAAEWNAATVLEPSEVLTPQEDCKMATSDSTTPPPSVTRDPTACTPETILFSLSVSLMKDLTPFLESLHTALFNLLTEARQAKEVLPNVLLTRLQCLQEEFHLNLASSEASKSETLEQTCIADSASKQHPFVNSSDSAISFESFTEQNSTAEGQCFGAPSTFAQTHRYRNAITCFPRTYNMKTETEHSFWNCIHNEREYVSLHSSRMQPLNVFYDCVPFHSTRGSAPPPPPVGDLQAGWYGGSVDADDVVLTAAELSDAQSFRVWLEEVTEQATLSRECHDILSQLRFISITRDAALPLCNFLSFLRLLSGPQGDAARALFAQRAGTDAAECLHIVVSHDCDIRASSLYIPWFTDISQLITLLQTHETLSLP